jgi:hypothetical protein
MKGAGLVNVMTVTVAATLAACDAGPTMVTIQIPIGEPDLVAYKADSAWHRLPPSSTTFQISTTGEYEVVTVCTLDPGAFDVEHLIADVADGDQVVRPTPTLNTHYDRNCFLIHDQNVPPVGEITGSVVQAGALNIGGFAQSSATPNWTYDMRVYQGVSDLVFTEFVPDKVVIRRDIAIGALTQEAPIDLATEGLFPISATVTSNIPTTGSLVSTDTFLVTKNGSVVEVAGSGSLGRYKLLPSTVLVGSEHQYVVATGIDGAVFEQAVVPATGDIKLTFPVAPTVSFTTTTTGTLATWHGGPIEYTSVDLEITDESSVIHTTESHTIADHRRALDSSLDPSMPGFDPAWHPTWVTDLTTSKRAETVHTETPDACYDTITSDPQGGSFVTPRCTTP